MTAHAYPAALSSGAASTVRRAEAPPSVVLAAEMRERRETMVMQCRGCGGWHRAGRKCAERREQAS